MKLDVKQKDEIVYISFEEEDGEKHYLRSVGKKATNWHDNRDDDTYEYHDWNGDGIHVVINPTKNIYKKEDETEKMRDVYIDLRNEKDYAQITEDHLPDDISDLDNVIETQIDTLAGATAITNISGGMGNDCMSINDFDYNLISGGDGNDYMISNQPYNNNSKVTLGNLTDPIQDSITDLQTSIVEQHKELMEALDRLTTAQEETNQRLNELEERIDQID